jgi:MFS family permease
MTDIILSLEKTNKVYRIAVGVLFFLQGMCFASWASRIPSIQQQLGLSDSLLGVILFALPVGSMLSLLFSGALVNKFGSKKVAGNALLLYSLFLPVIGLATNAWLLIGALVLFGMAGNIGNIAINTQAVHVEARYGKKIMASFHGLWSLAGFLAAGVGSLMISKGIIPLTHFVLVTTVIVATVAIIFNYLVPEEKNTTATSSFFAKPDKGLLKLGILAFCCMICEGAMFDWSGIYFQKVVQADKSWVGAGYTAFMCAMATGRFVADWVANRLQFKKTIFFSGLLIATGLGIAVIFPFLITSNRIFIGWIRRFIGSTTHLQRSRESQNNVTRNSADGHIEHRLFRLFDRSAVDWCGGRFFQLANFFSAHCTHRFIHRHHDQ